MELKQNFDRLVRDAREYLGLKTDELRLLLVDNLSVFMSDLLSWLAIFAIVQIALVCLLAVVIIAIASVAGYMWAFAVVAFVLLAVAGVFYLLRDRLFADIAVERFCRMFFPADDADETP